MGPKVLKEVAALAVELLVEDLQILLNSDGCQQIGKLRL